MGKKIKKTINNFIMLYICIMIMPTNVIAKQYNHKCK